MPEAEARCAYPCDTGRRCSSAGGILVDNGNQISESQQEAETAFRQSPCSNQSTQTGPGTGGIQTGTGTGPQTGINTGIGTGQTSTGQTGAGQRPQPGLGISQPTGGKRLAMLSRSVYVSHSL